MLPKLEPAAGAAGWQISNPPILSTAPLIASLALFDEAGIDHLRAKSVALTSFLAHLLEELGPAVQLITPRAQEGRGSQLSLRISGAPGRGRRVFERLTARGLICDWREPDTIRVALVPLYNRFADAVHLAGELALALEETGT
jgi:kynureninase